MANSVPVFAGLNPPTFSENAVNGAAQVIDSSVTLTDAEGNFSGGTLTVSGMLAEDMIAIRNEGNGAGEVGFANGLVTYGGTFIGFAGMVDGAFSVLFNANATTAAVDALVENLTYANSSQTPTASRSLQVTVTDATGETAPGGGMPVFVERFGADNPLSAATEPFLSRPTFADLDDDGDLDVLVGRNSGNMDYYENIGTAGAPVFASAITNPFGLPVVAPEQTASPSLADLDGDGDNDLIVGYFSSSNLYYFENLGSESAPSFAAPVQNAFGLTTPSGFNRTPTFADLDADGDLDAIVGIQSNFYYFENTGSATAPAFAAPLQSPFGLGTASSSSAAPSFGDFDGDGDLDLMFGQFHGETYYRENVGTAIAPSFATEVHYFTLGGRWWSAPAAADIDSDGDVDVFIGGEDGDIKFMENITPRNVATLVVTVTAQNDAPALVHPLADQTTPEDQAVNLTIPADAFSDPDGDAPGFTATLADGSALPTWLSFNDSTRTFSGAPPLNVSGVLHLKVTASDATLSVSDTFTLTITPMNDAPMVAGPVTLAAIDEDSGARLITQAELLLGASDVDGPSLAAVNLQISAGLGALADNGDQTWTYTPAANDDTSVAFTYQVTDGTTPVATSARLFIDPVPDTPQVKSGTPGDDGFIAPAGDWQIDGLGGIDTIAFDFKLTDATITWVGNQVIVNGPSSHTVLTGFEKYVFTDGTVNNDDGDVLVDDLFYYSTYRDIWDAHADPDAHYHGVGWKEGRDPDAFFSTVLYRALNADVKASGRDPLIHFDQNGWKQGWLPSLDFDPAAYLAANPDVKAAGVNPLAHFLGSGAGEGRQPFTAAHPIGPRGFDYIYYLQNNPDVAVAGVDPLAHFNQFGWKEGRNPNLFFDINGYLANYADVKAAGINPLDHYNQFGWHEGRDPSVNFDTTSYLANYPDIAGANINPLVHFLQYGMHEGRSAFADGTWG